MCFSQSYRWITISLLACVQVFCSLLCPLEHSLVLVWGSNVQEDTKIDQHQSSQQEEEIFHMSLIEIFTWIPITVASCSNYDNKETCHIASKSTCNKKSTHHQSLKTLRGLGIGKLKTCGGEWTRVVTQMRKEWMLVLTVASHPCGLGWIPWLWFIIMGVSFVVVACPLTFLWVLWVLSSLHKLTHSKNSE